MCLVDCLSPFCLVLFLQLCSVLSFGAYFLLSSFDCLPEFVSMYYVGLSYLSVLVDWPYVVSVLRGPVALSFLVTWAKCSRCAFCMGCACPPIIVEPWLLFAHQWEGLTLRLIDCEDWLVRGWLYWVGFSLAELWCLPSLPFECSVLRYIPGWRSGCLKLVSRVFTLEPLEKGPTTCLLYTSDAADE